MRDRVLSFFKAKTIGQRVAVQLLDDAVVLVISGGNATPHVLVQSSNKDHHLEHLRQLISKYKLAGSSVMAVLAPLQHKSYVIDKPPVPDNELAQAAKWKVRDFLGFSVEEAVVDIFDYPDEALRGRDAQLNMRVARDEDIKHVVDVVHRAGLSLTGIVTSDLTLSALFQHSSDVEATGGALLYLGETFGLFIFVREHQLYLAREFEFSFSKLVDASQQERSINQLTLEIQRSFDYLESQMGLAPPKKLSISTPDTRLPLPNMIAGELGIEIENFAVEAQTVARRQSGGQPDVHRGMFALGAVVASQPDTLRVDLYAPEFHPEREHLALHHVLISTATAIVLMVLLVYWQHSTLENVKSQHDGAQAQVNALEQEVAKLEEVEPSLVVDQRLAKSVEAVRSEVDAYRSLLAELGSQEQSFEFPYSSLLEVLAAHRPEKLWLTEFSINNLHGDLDVQGVTVDAKEIPAYLDKLQSDEIFASHSFGSLEIEQHADNKGLYVFDLHTGAHGGDL